MTLTEEQIEEIKARAEAATPEPWRQEGPRVYFGYEGGIGLRAAPNPINNSHFIAHARTDIPLLISALEAAEARLSEALEALDALDRMNRGLDWCDQDEQARRWSAARRVLEAQGGE